MTIESWTLTDVENDLFVPNWKQEIAPGVLVEKSILQGGKQQGIDSIRLKSDNFLFEVLPTRGMSIWKVWAGEIAYGWKSPVKGPVHPSWVPLYESGGLGWLDGFDELLVRCGLESNGAPEHDEEKGTLLFPLHGKIGNLPAQKVEVAIDGDVVKIIGVVEECRFHFMKMRMTSTLSWEIGSNKLKIEDEIENLSASDHEFQMLYHINFGIPLLDAGSQLVAPVKTVVPRNDHAAQSIDGWQNYAGPTPGFEEQVYFLEMAGDDDGNTRALLKNAHGTAGVSVGCNVKQLPCFTVWKNTTAIDDGYVTGLEPGTNFPNPRSFEGEHKRSVKLGGNQKTTLTVELAFLISEDSVSITEKEIRKLAPSETKVFDKPQPDWCHGVEEQEEQAQEDK